MRGLTRATPKPLLKVGGKTFLAHIFDALPREVNEVIIVIGFAGDQIRNFLGARYKGRRIRYVVQKKLGGTAKAALLTKAFFQPDERFFIIYGDELPTRAEIRALLKHPLSWLCHPLTTSIPTGVAELDTTGRIVSVSERRSGSKPPFLSVGGVMLVSGKLFSYRPWRHPNGEYYLTSMLGQFLKDHSVHAVIGRRDLYFSTPEDIDRFRKTK